MDNKWKNVKKELKKFFFKNKGKLFCIVVAIGTIFAVILPLLDIIKKNNIVEINDSKVISIDGDGNTIIVEYERTDANVEIVDLKINEDGEFPILDIKVRNKGDFIAYLHTVKIYMLNYFQMENIHNESYYEVEPSSNYDIVLSNEDEQIFDISQAVPQNGVDRFTITLATNTGDPGLPAICYFYAELIYNENDIITTSKMIIPINNGRRIAAKYVGDMNYENAKKNYEELLKIDNYTDAVKSNLFNSILESYKENEDDFIRK